MLSISADIGTAVFSWRPKGLGWNGRSMFSRTGGSQGLSVMMKDEKAQILGFREKENSVYVWRLNPWPAS